MARSGLVAADGERSFRTGAAREPARAISGVRAVRRSAVGDPSACESVAEGLRGWTSVPIIVLSTRAREAEKVAALNAGANDYMTKPFGMAEFMARLRVALQDRGTATEAAVVETADFTIDLAAKRAFRADRNVPLTATEWEIVQFLARNPGRLVSRAIGLSRQTV
jgi:two-component system, OmpR family, KDP operon response regulator KdpE